MILLTVGKATETPLLQQGAVQSRVLPKRAALSDTLGMCVLRKEYGKRAVHNVKASGARRRLRYSDDTRRRLRGWPRRGATLAARHCSARHCSSEPPGNIGLRLL